MEKVNALGERLKVGGAEMGRKMSAGMSSVTFKVKEFIQEVSNSNQSQSEKLVSDTTSGELEEPNWDMILHICDLINGEKLDICELVRAINSRLVGSKSPRGQYLALVLLEAVVKNCDNKGFLAVATERVLDEMMKLVYDHDAVVCNRNKALMMIQAWGESTNELRYLPVFEQTYKSLKSRGIRFPNRDNESLAPIFTPPPHSSAPSEADVTLAHLLQQHDNIHVQSFTSQQAKEVLHVAKNCTELLSTMLSSSTNQDLLKDDLINTLVQQCRHSQSKILKLIQSAGDNNNEALLFESLNVNDEIQKVLSKYEELKLPSMLPPVVAIEHDDSPDFTKEDHHQAMIRKPSSSSSSRVISHDDMIDDLDEMIFGKRGVDHDHTSSHAAQDPKKHDDSSKFDLISL